LHCVRAKPEPALAIKIVNAREVGATEKILRVEARRRLENDRRNSAVAHLKKSAGSGSSARARYENNF
jgi:hypothetical protein